MALDVVVVGNVSGQVNSWINQLKPDLARQAAAFGNQEAAKVADRVPVLTGTLAGSVKQMPDPEGVAVGMGDGVPYAGWIEFGGSRGRDLVPAGRYVYPTLKGDEPVWVGVCDQAAADSIRRYPWT